MNGNGGLLLDTNIILDFLKGETVVVEHLKKREQEDWYASVITRMELLSFHALEREEEDAIREFLGAVVIVPLHDAVEDAAVRLRRAIRCKMPDAVVAASAVVTGTALLTRDRVLLGVVFPGLRVEGPG